MSDPETLKAYAAKVLDYERLVSRQTPDRDLRAFLDALPRPARVLDLGCGPGNSAAMLREAGLEVDAWDATPEMVELARSKYGLDAKQADFDALSSTAEYDGIWANFSLLHARRKDMPRHLAAIHCALKPGGLFHIGLKTGEGHDRDEIGRYYTYYSEPELLSLLETAGFTHNTSRHGRGTGLSGRNEPFMIVTAYA